MKLHSRRINTGKQLMNRRRLLATCGASVAALAGCTGMADDEPDANRSTETPTPTDTPTEMPTKTSTETPTPEPDYTPEVIDMALVDEYEEFGDLDDNEIKETPADEWAIIAYRASFWVHDGSFDVTTQRRVYDADGSRVFIDDHHDEQLYEGDGRDVFENGFTVPPEDLNPGTHTAEVIIRDNVVDEVSEAGTVEFEVVAGDD